MLVAAMVRGSGVENGRGDGFDSVMDFDGGRQGLHYVSFLSLFLSLLFFSRNKLG